MEEQTLTPVDGVPKQIGYYLAGMEEVRAQLREAVSKLTNAETHRKLRPDTHSIAQLILHCGEAEWWWIQCVVNGQDIDDELEASFFWDVLEEGNEPLTTVAAAECIEEIDRISGLTKDLLEGFSDGDLDRVFVKKRPDGLRLEKSLRWILHHLTDHEAQHKGQILMLKRLMQTGGQ